MKQIIVTLAAARGIGPEALKKWRQRGKVPFKHRFPLMEDAKKKGVRLDVGDLEFEGTANSRRKRKAA